MECDEPRSAASHDWALRQTLSEERWEEARPKLLDSLLASDCVHYGPCDHCSLKQAVIRCKDCFPKPRYCGQCDVSTHQHLVFHNRETLIDGFYKPLPPSTAVQDLSGQNVIYEQVCLLPITRPDKICDCDPQNLAVVAGRSVVLICINGRYDVFLPVMNCRACLTSWTPEVVDLLFSGYWPGTVEFQTIYKVDLFTSFEDLKITAPGLSRQAFVKMLQQRSQQFGRSGNICGNVFQKAFLEWTYCRHKREKLCGIDHFSCPACTPDTVAVSADGNRKLYRFSKTKGTEEQPFFDGVFLANDKDVATFVDCVREKTIPVHGKGICGTSTWAAARETSKKTNTKCDEEGLEVAVCRHSILLRGLNMFRGEIFAYPLFLQKELATKTNCKFFCTDIMCRYWPYLQKVAQAFPEMQNLTQMKPFLSVMHAKGHSTKCEVQWGGKNQTGAGTTIGEEVEQVNSFLSRVALTTKYMSKAARVDMITLHARGWNERKKRNLHKYLSTRYLKVSKKIKISSMKTIQKTKEVKKDIAAIKKCTQRSDEELQQWVTDVRQWAVDTPDDFRTDDPVALQHLIEGLFLGIQQKKRDLYRVTDRNKQRHKIRRRIREDKKKLFNAISQYNDLPTTTEFVDSVEDLLAAERPIWPWDSEPDTSLGMKKKVFDKVMQLERLIEEEAILLEEMKQHWTHLTRTCRALKDQANVLADDLATQSYPSGLSGQAYHGLHSAVLQKCEEIKTDMVAVKETYSQIVVNGNGGSVVEEDDEDPYENVSTDASTDDEL
ncbi:uncharacterized protein LOC127987303 isoform X1 [Carassius gibelio]|uniref:uncharacterized protein LOC127987303 isoform X1 n=1 Tax=Carassius gibelio TaxID=101364 RepID=UPI0022779DDD|nr:uncharacterized protein LOC127987303 isoform X1 [Carassius gibelio]XP_052445522.1 uncharacterized protein LOC127987303 isoform X1 [Carassius gibelio]XP_052445523.1 uncharacterized protein LOC127987303 isoform X1 [Carassius gibelio]XP_052445524.1 uncharacterized protein LOC127987303 isoform X1 [Carassius gibelio]